MAGDRVRGAPLSPAQWVLAHAPSTRTGGAGQVVSVAAEFAKPANAAVVKATASGRIGVRSAAAVLAEADKLRPMLVEGAHEPVLEGLIAMAQQHGPRGCRMVRRPLLARFGGEAVLQRPGRRQDVRRAVATPRVRLRHLRVRLDSRRRGRGRRRGGAGAVGGAPARRRRARPPGQ